MIARRLFVEVPLQSSVHDKIALELGTLEEYVTKSGGHSYCSQHDTFPTLLVARDARRHFVEGQGV